MTHVGIGYNVHQLVAGRKLFLGGVGISAHKGLDGHSDVDALMHAILRCDSRRTARAGYRPFFPNSDRRGKTCVSKIFLEEGPKQISKRNGKLVSVDVTVIAQTPKICPHIAGTKNAPRTQRNSPSASCALSKASLMIHPPSPLNALPGNDFWQTL
jgi:2-C-methyl-D-erythritol 2,4-cyclodiphosphate synthase